MGLPGVVRTRRFAHAALVGEGSIDRSRSSADGGTNRRLRYAGVWAAGIRTGRNRCGRRCLPHDRFAGDLQRRRFGSSLTRGGETSRIEPSHVVRRQHAAGNCGGAALGGRGFSTRHLRQFGLAHAIVHRSEIVPHGGLRSLTQRRVQDVASLFESPFFREQHGQIVGCQEVAGTDGERVTCAGPPLPRPCSQTAQASP